MSTTVLQHTSIKVNPETWKQMKIRAVRMDKDVQVLAEEAFQLYLKTASPETSS
jgi:hypothetical protein